MTYDRYESPLSERYASREMQYIFSPDMKLSLIHICPQTVKAKQQFLKDKGYYKGSVDGSYGPETCKADQKWLNANYNEWK